MNTQNYFHIIKSKWQLVVLTSAILVLLTIGISLLQPFEYRSTTDFLVVQRQLAAQDAYTAARASERLASGLAAVIETDSFYQKVIQSSDKIAVNWEKSEVDRRKQWQDMVDTSISAETGILSINVYSVNKNQARVISNAIAHVLITQASDYHGAGNSVYIKVINNPLVSEYPVRPAIVVNAILALLAGLVLSSTYVVFVSFNTHSVNSEVAEVVTEQPNIATKDIFDSNADTTGIVREMLKEALGKETN